MSINKTMPNPWKKISETDIYDNPWINIKHFEVTNPAGGPGIYGKVHFKNLAIGIIALDEEENIYLVGQYRFAIDAYSLEIPEGGCPENESPLIAAKRELLEETGIKATNWQELLTMYMSNSVTDEKAIVFLATGLSQHEMSLEDTEDIMVHKMRFTDVLQKIMNTEITDAITVSAVLKLAYQRNIK